MRNIESIIFDLGGVLIDWSPDYIYDTIFDNEKEKKHFFDTVCTMDWNENQDAGYPIAQATEERVALFPEYESQIRAYYGRWVEMLGGPIIDSVHILESLMNKKIFNLYALTNWSHELFPIARERYEFLQWFEGIVVSGEEKTRKPYPEIYHLMLNRYNIDPSTALFIDDNQRNIQAAEEIDIRGILFESPKQLESELIGKYDIII